MILFKYFNLRKSVRFKFIIVIFGLRHASKRNLRNFDVTFTDFACSKLSHSAYYRLSHTKLCCTPSHISNQPHWDLRFFNIFVFQSSSMDKRLLRKPARNLYISSKTVLPNKKYIVATIYFCVLSLYTLIFVYILSSSR